MNGQDIALALEKRYGLKGVRATRTEEGWNLQIPELWEPTPDTEEPNYDMILVEVTSTDLLDLYHQAATEWEGRL